MTSALQFSAENGVRHPLSPRRYPPARRIAALAVSVALHVLVVGLLVLLTLGLPFRAPAPETPATIDIIEGTGPAGAVAPPPQPPAPPPAPAPTVAPPPKPVQTPPPTSPPPKPEEGEPTAPPQAAAHPPPPDPPPPAVPTAAAPASPPAPQSPPTPQPPPVVRLGGGDDFESAKITEEASRLRPAAPDKGNPPPVYPPESARLREQGIVTLRVHVAADGSVAGVEIEKSSGSPRLDRAASDQIASVWHFKPALNQGHAVPDVFDLSINFVLD